MSTTLHITSNSDLERHYQSLPDRVHTVTEFIGIMEYRWLMKIHYFRGEPQLYDTPCLPSIWRGPTPTPATPTTVWTVREQELVDEFRDSVKSGAIDDPYFAMSTPATDDSPEWLELAQHYGCPTRLLDVTLDPLVALFFATSKHDGLDGAVYLSNGSSFNTLDPGEYNNSLSRFFDIYELRDYSPADDTLFLYRPLARNRRMIAQRGQFVWCRGIGHSLRTTDTRIVIDGESKPKIRAMLERLGYNEANMLPPPNVA